MKGVLVHLDDGDGAAARLELAIELARGDGGSVHCVYPIRGPRIPVPAMSHPLSREESEAILREPEERLRAARARFDTASWGSGIPVTWEAEHAAASTLVARSAPYADLLVVGPPGEEGGLPAGDVFGLICDTLRPVLVAPAATPRAPGFARALVAWNGKREAARTLHEALPLLERAEHVTALVVEDGSLAGGAESLSAPLLESLSVRGIAAEAMHRFADDPGRAGAVILAAAQEARADLLVMGAFGHSRVFEYWLGGATRDVLQLAELPVLLAH